MASKGQMTGMLGVYLVAAELTSRDFIVALTSRSAAGADLLVTNRGCSKTWSVQVKTNRNPTTYWLLSADSSKLASPTHLYVFVNVRGSETPEYLVAESTHVAAHIDYEKSRSGSEWYSFAKANRQSSGAGWELFTANAEQVT